MELALQEASENRLLPGPNPAVGCVLVSNDGRFLAKGHTQKAGGPHAEIMALRSAQAQGHSVTSATAYVTLEPCSHHGRTGPCCDALIKSGIRKVVTCATDPNPQVAGQGIARLRAAGVEVDLLADTNPLAIAARELNLGFFSRMKRKTPWVRMKIAASLDGKTALLNGTSQWLTSAPARADGHWWRARSDAVLTGIGTVLKDMPRLDVRLVPTLRQPHLVVVDSCLKTPPDAPLFLADRRIWIYTAVLDGMKKNALEGAGASIIHMPDRRTDQAHLGKVDLTDLLQDLGQREINELHVEAGHKLNAALLGAGLVDEFLVYLSPKFIGQGLCMVDGQSLPVLTDLANALTLEFKSALMLGPDLRLLARVSGRDLF